MKIQIQIKKKVLETAIKEAIHNALHSNFKQETLEKAKIPTLKQLTRQILKNPKILKEYKKQLTARFQEEVVEETLHIVHQIDLPKVHEYAQDAQIFERVENNAKSIQNAEKFLKSKGYTVTKPKPTKEQS